MERPGASFCTWWSLLEGDGVAEDTPLRCVLYSTRDAHPTRITLMRDVFGVEVGQLEPEVQDA